jgi:hypothetical protein
MSIALDLNDADRLLEQLRDARDDLAWRCARATGIDAVTGTDWLALGVDAPSCWNVVTAIDDFVGGAAARLYAKAYAGDEDALARLLHFGGNILAVAQGAPASLEQGITPADLASDIAASARAAAPFIGAGLVALALAALYVVTR